MVMPTKRSVPTAHQEVCIDLPGEAVQCWRSGDKLKVVLRKHRDVIFDLNLNDGNAYTIESTHSDFYSARDKKIIIAKHKEVVSFRDGERMHIWVARSFKGVLLLKCGSCLMARVDPNNIDQNGCDEDPKTKPSPIIFALDSKQANVPVSRPKESLRKISPVTMQRPAVASVDEECTVVCVVEATLKNAPEKILKYFEDGGKGSGLVDFDPFDVATRNWIWGQSLGALAYVRDNWDWLRASIDTKTHKGIRLVSAKMHRVRGKVRFYFSGYSKFNSVFGPGGFGPGNERILSIFSGAGTTASTFSAMAKNLMGMFRGNALISFIFGSGTALAEWRKDVNQDGYDLTASLLVALLKAVLVTWLAGVVVAFLGMLIMGAAKVSLSVLLVGAVMIVVGIGLGYIFDALEKSIFVANSKEKGSAENIAEMTAPYLRAAGRKIEASWDYLMKKFSSEYQEIFFEKS